MSRRHQPIPTRVAAPLTIGLLAAALRGVAGVGFINYDTLYALVWGQQLARGQTPQYGVAVAPTPHPLIEGLGLLLAPLGASATREITVGLAFIVLAATGWVIFRLGAAWFGRWAGAVAALLLLTRTPVLSYGVRAYVDLPYLLLVLGALLVESGRRRAGAPVLVLLGLAGLLRPEAWAFAGLYWLWLVPSRTPSQLLPLGLLAVAAPLLWLTSDWLITGHPLWSLTNTRHTARALGRTTGLGKVPEYVPRRIGEILRPPVLLGSALGGVLSLLWLRDRARLGAVSGLAAVVVFAAFAGVGLPINTRYAFLVAALLCVFCGAGLAGWECLERGDRRRRLWQFAALAVVLALLAFAPSQFSKVHAQLQALARQQRIQGDLIALVHTRAIAVGCEPVGVPNHAPIPLLALELHAPPARVVDAQVQRTTAGTYVDPANAGVNRDYVLDPRDPHPIAARVPAGFRLVARNRSWRIYRRCAPG